MKNDNIPPEREQDKNVVLVEQPQDAQKKTLINATDESNTLAETAKPTESDSSAACATAPKPLAYHPTLKKVVSLEGFVCLFVVVGIFVALGIVMGFSNAINSLFATAYHLLMETVWYLLAIIVVMGALAEVLNELGVVSLANKAFAPLMKPLFGMPGATSMAVLSSFLSDNPAVLTLADNKGYRRYFKKYQLGALTNIGTTYGMGLIVLVSIMTLKSPDNTNFIWQPLIGLLAVFITSIFVTRLMLMKTKKIYGKDTPAVEEDKNVETYDISRFREVRKGSIFSRLFGAMLDGGEQGVKIGMGIIPGVLIIATLVLMLSNGKPASGEYSGAYGEGVGLIPLLGNWLSPVLKPLFGFANPNDIAVPLTALGSAGAALSLLKDMPLTSNSAAVFTAMCMFWSGYLSTHVSMMDNLKMRELTGWAILFHTIGGIVAGLLANAMVSLILLF